MSSAMRPPLHCGTSSGNCTMALPHTRRAAALAASLASLSVALLTFRPLRKPDHIRRLQRSRRAPKYRRAALLRPVDTSKATPSNQILSCGVDDDFLVSANFTKVVIIEKLQPYFEVERAACNFGSPYRHAFKTRGRKPFIESIGLLALALWLIKTNNSLQFLSCLPYCLYEHKRVDGLLPRSINESCYKGRQI